MFLTTSPIAFVKQHTNQLAECSCPFFNRDKPNNARDFMDFYTAFRFDEDNWPKDRPIRMLDIGSGGLLQVATTMTSLADHGYLVELVIVDENLNPDSTKLQSLLHLCDAINTRTGKQSIKLLGHFTCLDSYLATLNGIQPLKFQMVPIDKIREHTQAGIKRRYLLPHIGKHAESNAVFQHEFNSFVDACKDKIPDLVSIVDDITEFHPYSVSMRDYADSSDRTFSFQYEILEPFSKLNSNIVVLGTKKGNRGVAVQAFLNKHNFNPVVVYEYEYQQDEYRVIRPFLPVQSITTGPVVAIGTSTSRHSPVVEINHTVAPKTPAVSLLPPATRQQTTEMAVAEAAFNQLLEELYSACRKIYSTPRRIPTADKIKSLHADLQREGLLFFHNDCIIPDNQLINRGTAFITFCTQRITNCEEEIKPTLSRWDRVPSILKKLIGLLLSIPALLVIAFSQNAYKGYKATFFPKDARICLEESKEAIQNICGL